MADAEAALGRLDGVTQLLPNPGLLVRSSVVREAVASTRIEGTRATIREVYDADAANVGLSPDLEEVVNYVRATEHAVSLLETLPISMRLVREAHRVLLEGVRGRAQSPGELRQTQNWVGAPGSTIETATYVPPPPDAMLTALDDWEQFANTEADDMAVLAQCALMHYQFEAIHPFLDGNGRVERLLIVLFLIARRRITRPVLYVSQYFEGQRDTYIGHLQAVHERGDADPWIRFFCAAVLAEADDAMRRALRLVELREQYRRQVRAQPNAQALIDAIFETPVLTGRLVEHRLGVTRPTALRLLGQLADDGILAEQPAGRRAQRRWEAIGVLNAITEEAGATEITP